MTFSLDWSLSAIETRHTHKKGPPHVFFYDGYRRTEKDQHLDEGARAKIQSLSLISLLGAFFLEQVASPRMKRRGGVTRLVSDMELDA